MATCMNCMHFFYLRSTWSISIGEDATNQSVVATRDVCDRHRYCKIWIPQKNRVLKTQVRVCYKHMPSTYATKNMEIVPKSNCKKSYNTINHKLSSRLYVASSIWVKSTMLCHVFDNSMPHKSHENWFKIKTPRIHTYAVRLVCDVRSHLHNVVLHWVWEMCARVVCLDNYL